MIIKNNTWLNFEQVEVRLI